MKQFFHKYFNLKDMFARKREYKQQMERVKHLPEDYQFVFHKIQTHMWQFVSGDGYDMMEVQYGLIDLFEEGAANGRGVLEITGEDVAGFVSALLENTRTYPNDWKKKLNEQIRVRLQKP